jgi:hypothetical protein
MSGGALEGKKMHLMKTLDDAWNSQDCYCLRGLRGSRQKNFRIRTQ